MFSCSLWCQRIRLHRPPLSGRRLYGTQHLPEAYHDVHRSCEPEEGESNVVAVMKAYKVHACTLVYESHGSVQQMRQIWENFINFSQSWSNIFLIGCFLQLDQVTARGQNLQDVYLTGGDPGWAPQSSHCYLNTETVELSSKKCEVLFILSTSIVFDLCHTVKYKNAFFSLCGDTPTRFRAQFGGTTARRFFIDLSGTSESHLF